LNLARSITSSAAIDGSCCTDFMSWIDARIALCLGIAQDLLKLDAGGSGIVGAVDLQR